MAFVDTVITWLGAPALARESLSNSFHKWRVRFQAATPSRVADEPPLRAELLSAEQMEQHGRLLAQSHHLNRARASDRLLGRLAQNEAALVKTCDLLIAATAANRRIGPSGEWLLDNFYLVEEQIRTAKRHL